MHHFEDDAGRSWTIDLSAAAQRPRIRATAVSVAALPDGNPAALVELFGNPSILGLIVSHLSVDADGRPGDLDPDLRAALAPPFSDVHDRAAAALAAELADADPGRRHLIEAAHRGEAVDELDPEPAAIEAAAGAPTRIYSEAAGRVELAYSEPDATGDPGATAGWLTRHFDADPPGP